MNSLSLTQRATPYSLRRMFRRSAKTLDFWSNHLLQGNETSELKKRPLYTHRCIQTGFRQVHNIGGSLLLYCPQCCGLQ